MANWCALTAALTTLYLTGMAPAAAQDSTSGDPECALIENDAERLACYDRERRAPADVATESSIAVPPRPPAARSAGSDAEPPSVAVVIVAVRQRPGLNTLFTTEEGQIWAQLDFEQSYFPRPPFSAEIRPGKLGSFFLVPTRGTAVRVRRRQE
jgi:hypothetical protein